MCVFNKYHILEKNSSALFSLRFKTVVKCVGIGIRLPSLESQLSYSLTVFIYFKGEKKNNKIFFDALVSSDVKWGW